MTIRLSLSLCFLGVFSFFVALCSSVCVWLWENFPTVRESPPLSGPVFPMGSSTKPQRCSGGLLQTQQAKFTGLFIFDSQTTCIRYLCDLSPPFNYQAQLQRGREGGVIKLFSAVIKKTGKKNSPPINHFRWGTEIDRWVLMCHITSRRGPAVAGLLWLTTHRVFWLQSWKLTLIHKVFYLEKALLLIALVTWLRPHLKQVCVFQFKKKVKFRYPQTHLAAVGAEFISFSHLETGVYVSVTTSK